MSAPSPNVIADSLRQLYSRTPAERIAELEAAHEANGAALAYLTSHPTPDGAEALASRYGAVQRACAVLAHELAAATRGRGDG